MGRESRLPRTVHTHRIRLPPLSVVQQHPVVYTVLDFASVLESLGEEVSEEIVVGSLLEAELADVVEVDGEFLCVAGGGRGGGGKT